MTALGQRPAPQRARFGRKGRNILRAQIGQKQHPGHEQQHLHHAGAHRAPVHVTHRLAELVGKDDEHEGWRNELRDGARCGDNARGMAHVVAISQHDRQRDKPHGNDRGGNRAGNGAQYRAHQNDRIGKPAAHPAKELAKAFEQVLRQAAALKDGAHQREKRNGQQQVIAHHRFELEYDIAEKIRLDKAEFNPDETKEQADRRQGKGGGIAVEHEKNEPREHQGRHVVGDKLNHCTGFS